MLHSELYAIADCTLYRPCQVQRSRVGIVMLDRILVTPLKRITTAGGDVLHAMRRDDQGYAGFGEAYFSIIEKGVVKAWKCHARMTLNLIVSVGTIRFIFHVPHAEPAFREEVIGEQRYARLTVPPGIWFGFQGLAAPHSLVLNLASIPHDPGETFRKALHDISFDWT